MAAGKSRLGIVHKHYPKVTLVVDAKKSVEFTVTGKDSASGMRHHASECALAKACKREYDGAIISKSTAYLIRGQTAIRYEVPEAISRELVSFDRHHYFAPGVYKLRPPAAWNRLGADKRKKADRAGEQPRRKHGKSRKNHITEGVRTL